jgi:hypothetical protein
VLCYSPLWLSCSLTAGGDLIKPKPLILLGLVLLSVSFAACAGQGDSILGVVTDGRGPIPGAHVRIRAGQQVFLTDEDGQFRIDDLQADDPVTLTAWAPGYFIAALEEVHPGADPVQIQLSKFDDQDHPEYAWVSPFADAGDHENCENCHSDSSGTLPFEEWQSDAHANSLLNPRFLTMYAGTDMDGNQSPLTRIVSSRDYGPRPLPPNPHMAYYGPGYKLDFPLLQGNCSACHAPAAAVNAPYETDPLQIVDPGAEGITCDFCHKIWDVSIDEHSGLPYPNYPGVLSYEFRRPAEGHQFFAGPFDDVAPGEDTYTPIQTESLYCASCHFGVFWDTVIYNSYGEWLASPYSDPESGKTCQDCHMPPSGASHFALSEEGGLERDPDRIASHRMLGVTDEAFMQEALDLDIDATWESGVLEVEVQVANNNTGHKVPTDSPLRNVILLVGAFDEAGQPLVLLDGPRLPDWTGEVEGKSGHYAGQAGRGYALILVEKWTGISPTGSYWNPVEVVSDSRLEPMEVDLSTYRFEAPISGSVTVHTQLVFRRAFIELKEQKGWEDEDLVMAEQRLVLNRED